MALLIASSISKELNNDQQFKRGTNHFTQDQKRHNSFHEVVNAETTKSKKLSNERAGRILAGISVLFVLTLAITISPYFLLMQLFISANLIWSGFSDNCHIKTLLLKLGYKTERSLGAEEVNNNSNYSINPIVE